MARSLYFYKFCSKPLPLTSTAIAYECDIFRYGLGDSKVIASVYAQVNAYGEFDYALKEFDTTLDVEVEKQLKEHCLQRAKIVFATGKEEEEENPYC